jgi:hypothetical protein
MFAIPVTLAIVPNAEVLSNPAGVALASALIVTETAPSVAVMPATAATACPFTPGAVKADVASIVDPNRLVISCMFPSKPSYTGIASLRPYNTNIITVVHPKCLDPNHVLEAELKSHLRLGDSYNRCRRRVLLLGIQ